MARRDNGLGGGVGITENVGGRDADDMQTCAFHPGCAAQIGLRPLSHCVRKPIDLDDRARSRTIKVCNVSAHRMLAPQLHAKRAMA